MPCSDSPDKTTLTTTTVTTTAYYTITTHTTVSAPHKCNIKTETETDTYTRKHRYTAHRPAKTTDDQTDMHPRPTGHPKPVVGCDCDDDPEAKLMILPVVEARRAVTTVF